MQEFILQNKKAFIIGGAVLIVLVIILVVILVITLSPKDVVSETKLAPNDPRYIPGYKFYQGAEYASDVIPWVYVGATTAAMKKECDANDKCAGFNTFTKELLEDVQPMSQWGHNPKALPSEGIYLKDSFKYQLPVEVPGYVFLPGQSTNYTGNAFNNAQTVVGQPIDVVALACTKDNRCKSFNTSGKLQSEIYKLPSDYVTYTNNPAKGIYVKKEYADLVPASIKRATQFRK